MIVFGALALPILMSPSGEVSRLDVAKNVWTSTLLNVARRGETVSQTSYTDRYTFVVLQGEKPKRVGKVYFDSRQQLRLEASADLPSRLERVLSTSRDLKRLVVLERSKLWLLSRNKIGFARQPIVNVLKDFSVVEAQLDRTGNGLCVTLGRRAGVNSSLGSMSFYRISNGKTKLVARSEELFGSACASDKKLSWYVNNSFESFLVRIVGHHLRVKTLSSDSILMPVVGPTPAFYDGAVRVDNERFKLGEYESPVCYLPGFGVLSIRYDLDEGFRLNGILVKGGKHGAIMFAERKAK